NRSAARKTGGRAALLRNEERPEGFRPRPPGVTRRSAALYWTFAVSELAAFSVKVQVGLFTPPLLHTPDQITDRPLVALRVMVVPTEKLAEPVVPTGTFSPAGVERTRSPARPMAVRVSSAVAGATPQTFATPAPPQVSGAMQTPQVSVPPHPSGIVPQFFPRAAQVVGVQTPQTFATPPPPHVCGAAQTPQVSVPPHPSGMVPQFRPFAAQVVGVQGAGALARVPDQRVQCTTP